MIATAQGKLLACTKNTGKDKATGREFEWFKNDILTDKGVISLTGGKDFSDLIDKQVLVSLEVEGKDKVKLSLIEALDEEPTIV